MNPSMNQATIYIGLNDSETKVQKFSTEKYVSVLKRVCQNYHRAFSVHELQGGYFHEDGTYTEETTLSLMLIDIPEDTVIEIAKDLCAFFHQESVMVTTSPCSVIYVKENLFEDNSLVDTIPFNSSNLTRLPRN